MINKMKEKVLKMLDDAHVKYELIKLPENISLDVAEHMRFHGRPMKYALATMVYSTEKGFVAVQRRGDTKVSSKKLREFLGIKRLSLATKEELDSLGLQIGLVPPVGLDMPFYADNKMLELDEIYTGAADNEYGMLTSPKELFRVSHPIMCDVTEYESQYIDHPRILSGITPSGSQLHIGNYFGAVAPQIALQDTHETHYFVADLHALTTIHDRDQLEKNITGVVLDYLALGLDPNKCVFFRQSDVPEHSQLAVVLANYISYGQMKRMHAFKDKLQTGTSVDSINMGLFNYPILMAADILLYKPYGVPVGEDQRQHIELTRDIADSFNKAYKKSVFPLPEPMISKEVGKIIGTDGVRKMSKSLGNIIGIFEDEKVIEKQIMSSYTDPTRLKVTDPGKVEGNPVFIYHDLMNDNKVEVEELKDRYRAGTVGDVEVKQKLVAAHKRKFASARVRRAELVDDMKQVSEILERGAVKATQFAKDTLAEVYEVIGERNKLNI
ncbi:tryptophan--tRNA ligase [Candidatus Woesebacteria bacterium]|nr:tryptophan--tRNA ligase [Candidatus Woesebacteria bacterium]